MPDPFQTDKFDFKLPDSAWQFLPLPEWLANRLLRPSEKITWVYGPRRNPSWERFITNPVLFLVALAIGAVCLLLGWLLTQPGREMPMASIVAAGGIVVASIFVLGISNGYFTRLVVTNQRIVVLQGREICRSWSVHNLPPSLVRRGMRGRDMDAGEPTVDLEALKTMLGGRSDQIAERKTIMSFSKQLDEIRHREKDRP